MEQREQTILVTGMRGVGKTAFRTIMQEEIFKKIYHPEDERQLYGTTYFHENVMFFEGTKLSFEERSLTSLKDLNEIREMKGSKKSDLLVMYIDGGRSFDHSSRIVQHPNYAESGLYIPQDYFSQQKSLFTANHDLFDFTIVNDRSVDWMLEQGASFIRHHLLTKETVYKDHTEFNQILQPKITLELIRVNETINKYFALHPQEIHRLSPREFENLIAGLLDEMGYEVELTPETRDGGFDIRAVKNDEFGPMLYLVECKKNRPDRPVGVDIVRQLDSVKRKANANKSILVTTSYFSRDAKEYKRTLGCEMDLKQFDDIVGWLSKFKPI